MQLFFRERTIACFFKKELHRNFWNMTNTQGWRLQFAGLQFTKEKSITEFFLDISRKFRNSYKEFGQGFAFGSIATFSL